MAITDPPTDSALEHAAEDGEQPDTPTAWLIRAGRNADRYDYCVENGLVGVGFGHLPDLSEVSSRDEIAELVRAEWPEASDGKVDGRARQLWDFRSRVRFGDLVVMPGENSSQFALGIVTQEYWHDDQDPHWHHFVSVDWKRTDVHPRARPDLLRYLSRRSPTIRKIAQNDKARRLRQLLETGQDPGPQAGTDGEHSDLTDLVEQFRDETGDPTDAHEEQERLRAEWAEKLAAENVKSLTREDLLAYTNNAVEYGQYVDRGEGRRQQWILDLDDAEYDRLLDGIRDLCWGEDELSTRIDRLVDWVGGFNRDTGTKGFTGLQVSRTLAISFPEQFLPFPSQIGRWGRESALRVLGLPEPQGSYGQRVVDANNRLREHLAPHFDDDPQAIAGFLNWLREQETDEGASVLSGLVARFRAKSGFPTEAHEEQRRLRAEWAKKLAPETIESLSREDLTAFTNHSVNNGEYVRRVGGVMRWIRNLSDPEFDKLRGDIAYLCWGEDDLSIRFDQLYEDHSSRKVSGYAGVNISRTLAICHPDSFLPVHRNVGNWGRRKMLSRLGLPPPLGETPGQRVVDANSRLLAHLEPHFADDTLEMGAFLAWLLDQEPPPSDGPTSLAELAAELLVDVEFLKDIVELLKDKGQVILYGPPGTGKTYLARKLAKVLAPDDSCRALVQFHPSTSYEDFFEGYRPAETSEDGGIRYKMTPGPLARIAERASESSERHVMIIDEINRGNLPRVLGELLFLLEYRDEEVETLYRVEKRFSLPENLWFIGTMNTADRSIALVDAALRRRFHFVPFFPNRWPIADLLADWLERKDQPDWLGRLVDAVNDELERELGGPHLLLGPSHFMKTYGSSPGEQRKRLRRIWKYNIEPFIEDQFFGNRDQIERFRFESVWNRHGPSGGREVGTSGHPRDSGQGLASEGSGGDRELWTSRANDFPPQDHPGDESYHAEMRQVVRRYVEFALSRGADPGSRDGQLVEEFLSSHEPEYADKTKTDYRLHVRKWFDHVDVTWGT